jgi:(1->4)-alpha-D-glucan 1-alpha-D-glucosylmutase
MEKAVREAKRHTSWTQPQEDYERAVHDFVVGVLSERHLPGGPRGLRRAAGDPGRINGLAQIPDQAHRARRARHLPGHRALGPEPGGPGQPRPVDFSLRARLIETLEGLSAAEILARAEEGLPKLWVIRQALDVRRRHPELVGPGADYRPLEPKGGKAGHAVAYMRGGGAVVLAPRRVLGLAGDWGDTVLPLPSGTWHNVLTGDVLKGGKRPIPDVLSTFPVALLVRGEARP